MTQAGRMVDKVSRDPPGNRILPEIARQRQDMPDDMAHLVADLAVNRGQHMQ